MGIEIFMNANTNLIRLLCSTTNASQLERPIVGTWMAELVTGRGGRIIVSFYIINQL